MEIEILRKFRFVALGVLLAASIYGCEMHVVTYNEAERLLKDNKDTYMQIISFLRKCPAVRIVYSDKKKNSLSVNQCLVNNVNHSDEIAALLKRTNILWVVSDFKYENNRGASFVLSSYGIVGSGKGSAIWYFVDATHATDDKKPLAGSPGHWFYKLYS
jgi:hypothetical protein